MEPRRLNIASQKSSVELQNLNIGLQRLTIDPWRFDAVPQKLNRRAEARYPPVPAGGVPPALRANRRPRSSTTPSKAAPAPLVLA